jgi:uncharacterized protein (UPF0332 family)
VTWLRGRETVERLLADGELDRVKASVDVADRLMQDAKAHVALAAKGTEIDPAGALQLAYDAARKASAALLAVQGLRPTSRGGHIAVIEAVRAQFNNRDGMEVFGRINRLRRRRNTTEYPSEDSPGVAVDEAEQAVTVGRDLVDAAQRLLESGRLGEFV